MQGPQTSVKYVASVAYTRCRNLSFDFLVKQQTLFPAAYTFGFDLRLFVCLLACLVFNGTFSTNRLYRAITVGKYIQLYFTNLVVTDRE